MNQKRTHIYIYNTSCKCTLLYALSEKETATTYYERSSSSLSILLLVINLRAD